MSDQGLGEASGQEARPQPGTSGAATPSDAEILERAADLLARPGGWTKGAFSRNAEGGTDTGDGRWAREPVCFCLRGALAAAAGRSFEDVFDAYGSDPLLGESFAEAALGGIPLVYWNDKKCASQEEAVAILRRAAAIAKAPSPSASIGGS